MAEARDSRALGSHFTGMDLQWNQGDPVSQKKTILVVDDNPVNRELMNDVLELFGHQAEFAASGEEAVSMCDRHEFRLIFMDISLPGIDGMEAMELIRAGVKDRQGVQPVVIALTAWATGSADLLEQFKGMDDVLAKPFKPDQVGDLVKKHLAEAVAPAPGAQAPRPTRILDQSAERLGIAQEAARGFVSDFFSTVFRVSLSPMKDALADGDYDLPRRLAETLKNAMRNLGLSGCDGVIARAVEALQSRDGPGSLRAVEDLEAAIHSLEQRFLAE